MLILTSSQQNLAKGQRKEPGNSFRDPLTPHRSASLEAYLLQGRRAGGLYLFIHDLRVVFELKRTVFQRSSELLYQTGETEVGGEED